MEKAKAPATVVEPMQVIGTGGCHCGRVRFEVMARADIVVPRCNCPICRKWGHLLVWRSPLTRLQGSGRARHPPLQQRGWGTISCSHCGIKSFHVPGSRSDRYNVNARCLDLSTVRTMTALLVGGRNWEQVYLTRPPEGFPDEEDGAV